MGRAPERGALPRLMLVTDRRRVGKGDLEGRVAEAVAGGVGIVQIREKDLPDDELRALASRLRERLSASTVLVINGRPRVAATLRMGLHLPAAEPGERHARLRRLLALWGRSAHDPEEARRAAAERADYLLLGTIYPTASKPGHRGSGPGLVERVAAAVGPLPVFAIGGVTVTRIPELVRAGAHGIASCGEILTAREPGRVAQAMALALGVATAGTDPDVG